MAGEYHGGQEEEWQMESLCRFHGFVPSMSKGPVPYAKDQLVDAIYEHPRMSFLDAFQGYHQIFLAVEDQKKTAFISPDANYHYTVMPFGLKNVETTYQRMMSRMFQDKIEHTVEVYIDDMVVKSKHEAQHIEDL